MELFEHKWKNYISEETPDEKLLKQLEKDTEGETKMDQFVANVDYKELEGETGVEYLADLLADYNAKYIKFDKQLDVPKETFGNTIRNKWTFYFEDIGEKMKQKYGNKDDIYFTFVTKEDSKFRDDEEKLYPAFIFSNGGYIETGGLTSKDDIEMIIGSGQL